MNNVDVSIIITNYNKADFIDRAIRSCINQIIFKKNIEIIVVDDCSTDESLQIISEFKDEIELIVNKKNSGVAFSSNAGLGRSSGKYVIRVDADDYISNLSLEILSQILDNNEEIDYDIFLNNYNELIENYKYLNPIEIKTKLKKLVPEYKISY
jgi:glycosyltransferase involved in cell wall biosynthesis